VTLYRIDDPGDLIAPTLVAAFDSWIDAGSASTTAANQLVEDGRIVVTFHADSLFDYRARRPTLEIVDGRPQELTWPELVIRHARIGERGTQDLTGQERLEHEIGREARHDADDQSCCRVYGDLRREHQVAKKLAQTIEVPPPRSTGGDTRDLVSGAYA